jgi:hypothetical protein
MEKARGACNKSHDEQQSNRAPLQISINCPIALGFFPASGQFFCNIVLLLRIKRHTKCIYDKALPQCYQIILFGMDFLPSNRAHISIKYTSRLMRG